MKHVAILVIQAYQVLLSPLLPPSCRFFPTCSQYAIQALRTRGFLGGSILALKRILRCHPWGGQGHDPLD
jgi:putative membrane protein insertion efficiency factor